MFCTTHFLYVGTYTQQDNHKLPCFRTTNDDTAQTVNKVDFVLGETEAILHILQ